MPKVWPPHIKAGNMRQQAAGKAAEMNAFRACFRKLQGLPWVAACSIALLFDNAAYGQAPPRAAETPSGQQTIPEIQPGHPAKGNAAPEGPEKKLAPSPQTAFPSSQPEGKEKGVIRPPPVGDTGVRTPPRLGQ
jgi:hypothetical protein